MILWKLPPYNTFPAVPKKTPLPSTAAGGTEKIYRCWLNIILLSEMACNVLVVVGI